MSYLYAVSNQYSLSKGLIKLGCTQCPISRLQCYRTGDAPDIDLDKYYLGLWEIDANSMETMKHKETILHLHFQTRRTKRNTRYTEWFRVTIKEVQSFMKTQSFLIKEVSIEEIEEIHRKIDNSNESQLKQLFFNEFLGNKIPRRIQIEVWDVYSSIVLSGSYRGIVQWATGTGKSVAMMILIVITAHYYQTKGEIYRGMLVTHKNDIFDTLEPYLDLLSRFGIHVVRGDHGHFSRIDIPSDKSILITATHKSLDNEEAWKKIPTLNHIHYDEVHRIGGDHFMHELEKQLVIWKTSFLTGTSATPKTSDVNQHQKLYRLFNNPLTILHRCDVEEAIKEEWIASPRFSIHVISDNTERDLQLQTFLKTIKQTFQQKNVTGKIIAYLPTRQDVKRIVQHAKTDPYWNVYNAIDDIESKSDQQFVKAINGIHILFACERYREGSDIKGLEMTVILMGKTICSYILLQIIGRALRLDYPKKEGWCMIMRPSDDGYTEEQVFDSIVLDIITFLDKSSNVSSIRNMINSYFGEVSVNGKVYETDETISRIQAMYDRKMFQCPKKERYEQVQKRNQELKLLSKSMYMDSNSQPLYINDPSIYFDKVWISWYHFLGIEISQYPLTKEDFIQYCKSYSFDTFEEYITKTTHQPPLEPSELYKDWTSWDDEMKTDVMMW